MQKGIIKNTKAPGHIDASDFSPILDGLYKSNGVIKYGLDLSISKVSDNMVRLNSGLFNLKGHVIKVDDYIDLPVDSGTLGMKRIDLLIAEYVKDGIEEGTDLLAFRVVKGTPHATSPQIPNLVNTNYTYQDTLYVLQISDTTLTIDTSSKKYTYSNSETSNPNVLMNGGFHVWQAGTDFSITSSNNRYTADGWTAEYDGQSYKIGKNENRLYMGPVTAGTTTKCTLQQPIEAHKPMYYKLKGEPTLSFSTELLSSDIDNDLDVSFGVVLTDNSKIYQSMGRIKSANGSIGYTKYTFTVNLPTTITDVDFSKIKYYQLSIKGSLKYPMYFKYIKLEYGNAATPYMPEDPATALMRCQRYYQNLGNVFCARLSTEASGRTFFLIGKNLYTTMRVTPRVTVTRLGSLTNPAVDTGFKISSISADAGGIIYIYLTATAAMQNCIAVGFSADARL